MLHIEVFRGTRREGDSALVTLEIPWGHIPSARKDRLLFSGNHMGLEKFPARGCVMIRNTESGGSPTERWYCVQGWPSVDKMPLSARKGDAAALAALPRERWIQLGGGADPVIVQFFLVKNDGPVIPNESGGDEENIYCIRRFALQIKVGALTESLGASIQTTAGLAQKGPDTLTRTLKSTARVLSEEDAILAI